MTRNRQFYERMSVYTEIHRLRESGHLPIQWIANYMGLNFRTVRKYLKMSLEEYERYAEVFGQKPRKLEEYKEFIADKLRIYPDTSAAQMHDWLKEAYPFFPGVSPPFGCLAEKRLDVWRKNDSLSEIMSRKKNNKFN